MLALSGGYYWSVFIRGFKRLELRALLKLASVIVISRSDLVYAENKS